MIRSQIAKARSFPPMSANKLHEVINLSSMVSNLTVFLENAGATPHPKYSLNNLSQYPSVKEFGMWLHEVDTYISLVIDMDGRNAETATNKQERVKPFFANTTGLQNYLKCKQNHHRTQC